MSEAAYVAVDWGTSSFRLWLTGHDGAIWGVALNGDGQLIASGGRYASMFELQAASYR